MQTAYYRGSFQRDSLILTVLAHRQLIGLCRAACSDYPLYPAPCAQTVTTGETNVLYRFVGYGRRRPDNHSRLLGPSRVLQLRRETVYKAVGIIGQTRPMTGLAQTMRTPALTGPCRSDYGLGTMQTAHLYVGSYPTSHSNAHRGAPHVEARGRRTLLADSLAPVPGRLPGVSRRLSDSEKLCGNRRCVIRPEACVLGRGVPLAVLD